MRIPALSIYDVILSISMEVRCIWKRKFGVGTVLYLSIRYSMILYVLLRLCQDVIVINGAFVSDYT